MFNVQNNTLLHQPVKSNPIMKLKLILICFIERFRAGTNFVEAVILRNSELSLEKSLTKNQTFTVCEYCDKERKQQSYYW
jgi:hypothetical protein